MRGFPLRLVLVCLAVLMAGVEAVPTAAVAQNNRLTDRSYLPSPVVRGMGDAGVALPGIEQGFFYNPAHLPNVPSHFTIFGVQGAASRSIEDQIRFYNEEVAPAAQSQFNLSAEAQANLYREADALRRIPGRGQGGILLPSFVYSSGAFGIGGGVFAKTAVNYRVQGNEADVPSVWLLNRTDVMALGSLGLDLRTIGLPGVSVGITGTQTRRFLTFRNEPLTRVAPEETSVRLEGATFQVDAGLTYAPGWIGGPGTVRFGGAVYDVLEHGYGYTVGDEPGRMPFLDDVAGRSGDDVSDRDARRARQAFALEPSYRVGAAYQLASLFFLDDVAVALDYQGYGSGGQPGVKRLHAGIRARLVGPLRVRAGLGAGRPSGGLGLEIGALHLDYALHGGEEGPPKRLRTYVHTVRLLLRLE